MFSGLSPGHRLYRHVIQFVGFILPESSSIYDQKKEHIKLTDNTPKVFSKILFLNSSILLRRREK